MKVEPVRPGSGCVQCGDCLVIVVEPGLCSCVYERVTSLPQSAVGVPTGYIEVVVDIVSILRLGGTKCEIMNRLAPPPLKPKPGQQAPIGKPYS